MRSSSAAERQGAGDRYRYTYYDVDGSGVTRGVVTQIEETWRPPRLFSYDALGRLGVQRLDLNGNGVLDIASVEPITTFTRQFVNTNGVWQDMSEVWRYSEDNTAVASLVQRARVIMPATFPTNLVSSNIVERAGGGTVITTVELNHATGELTTTVNDLELGQVRTRVQRDGLARSETSPGIATPRTYEYTALGELLVVHDPVTGGVTNSYDSATRRLTAVTDNLSRSTTYDYFAAGTANAGRVKAVQDPAGNWTYFDYTTRGETFRQWGVNTYPIEQHYDERGRMTNLVTFRTAGSEVNWASATWPDPPAGDVTTWVYDQPSGLLERKIYADAGTGAKAVVYTYDAGNFPDTKVNGRGQTIDYSFDLLGRMTSVVYSDGTPSATMGYDRAGRLRSVTDASGTRTLSWTDRDQIEDEVYTTGMLSGVSIDRTYDAQFRLERLEFKQSGVTQTRQRFAYDGISWLDYIADETPDGSTELHRFDYAFKTNTPFIESVAFSRSGQAVMTQSYDRDGLGRLAGAGATLAGGGTVYGVDYEFDVLNRRFEANLADGTKWDYGYNDRSEVTSGRKRLTSGAYEGGKQFEYGFDDIGNRTVARFGGDGTGANLSEAEYGAANALNQLTVREVPGSVWLTGEAPVDLALRGIAEGHAFALERQDGERFFGEALVNNHQEAVFARVTVAGKENGTLTDVETGHQFVSRNPEPFVYDADGNLTQDGRWTYVWDAENRLVSMTARADIPDAAKKKLEFAYDSMGRRVQKEIFTWNGSQYLPESTQRFVYDGWNLVAILDESDAVLQSFVWGLDLSGSSQGAGGVGGLLAVTVAAGPSPGSHFYTFDGNGNVMAMVDAAAATASARYEYGPFGEVIRASGPVAQINPFGFSTKYKDPETGLLYYGFRYYDPITGRWASRDPVEETGGLNLYGTVGNDPLNRIDPLGLDYRSWEGSLLGEPVFEGYEYTTGDTWIESQVSSINNIGRLLSNLTLGTISGIWGFLDWSSENTGVTQALGITPSEMAIAVPFLAPFRCSAIAPVRTLTRGRTIYVEPNGQLVLPYYAEMSPARLSVLRGSPVLGMEGVNSVLASQRLLRLELDFQKALCECAAKGGIQFGQASVKSTFAHGPHAGKTIGEVAEGLRAGSISPNTLPIDYVVRNGQAVTLNNRSLLTLQRAGIEPTVTRNLTGNQAAEALLNSHLQDGTPSSVIRVRGGPPGTSLIE